uniref:RING-type domain-containing protein n=1 Tax=Acrobeloides nanus TaxID=290746 RepID=A0A914E2N4_9BILA
MHECKMDDHMEICAGELVRCPYYSCGCVTMLTRDRILSHMNRCRNSPKAIKENEDEEEKILYINIKTGSVHNELPKIETIEELDEQENFSVEEKQAEEERQDEEERHAEEENFNIEEKDEVPPEPIEEQCPICIEVVDSLEGIYCLQKNDSHFFCKNCIKMHIETNVDELILSDSCDGIRCLLPECNSEILYGNICPLVEGNIVRRLEARFIDQNLSPIQNIERCKSCNFAMLIEDSFEKYQFFICLTCEAIFCRHCKRDGIKHYNENELLSCERLNQIEADEKNNRDIENEMSEAVIRKCHKCGLAFMKQDGCNKMTCRCGATQCYLCRAPNIFYDHFCGHDRNPGMPCNSCNKPCLLWELAEPKDEEAIRLIQRRNNRNLERIE